MGSRDLVDYLKKENAELKEQLSSEREHNRSIQREQIKLQQAHSVTQGQTNELLQRLTNNLQLNDGTSTPESQRANGVGESAGSSKRNRLRSFLTKEIHFPFVDRL